MIRHWCALTAAGLLLTGCGSDKEGAPPAGVPVPAPGPIEVPADLEMPSEEELEQRAQEAITPETADEEFERLRRELEDD